MKVRIPIMIQDPMTSRDKGIPPVEGFNPDNEEFFLDGPVTKRIAVLDFCSKTNKLLKGAIFQPPTKRKESGKYRRRREPILNNVKGKELYNPAFMQVSVFGTVLKTLYLFEGTHYASPLHKKYGKEKVEETLTHTLGRSLKWAFDAPQLLVIPRAGEWANAFYHRDSHSLQFFYFPSPRDERTNVYSCLSRDIVAHETGHAIIDGIAPDLMDAVSPQSLAIHEAIADITALLMAFDSHTLRSYVLKKSEGSLKDSTVFSSIAEEFGEALRGTKGLRNLFNNKNLKATSGKDWVNQYEPHSLSEVLSGALYSFLIRIYEDIKDKERTKKTEQTAYSASGRSLWRAARRLKRMAFRALDYLPPGEVSFVDYGRAMIAVDQVAYPKAENMRNWLVDEFLKRHIIKDKKQLLVETNFEDFTLEEYDAKTLMESDWAAYDFANKIEIRKLLYIPELEEPVHFQIRPRIYLHKKYDDLQGKELLFKVAWNYHEDNVIGSAYPEKRAITIGTTLVIDWETDKIITRLTSVPPEVIRKFDDDKLHQLDEEEYKKQKETRDIFLMQLVDEELLKIGKQALDSDGKPLLSAIQTEVIGNVMHTKGTGKLLHVVCR